MAYSKRLTNASVSSPVHFKSVLLKYINSFKRIEMPSLLNFS